MEQGSHLPHARAASTRSSGILETAHGPGCSDHACWAYSSRSERDAAAVEWLLGGARLGQRLFVVSGDDDGGAGLIDTIGGADARVGEEVANFGVDQLYDLSVPIDAETQLAAYADEVARAVADGFNGLRVFCDITPLISNPARRASHAHWEHVADAWMAEGNPLAPLCAYDIGVVGDQPQAVMAVHPLRHGPDRALTSFGLYCMSSKTMLGGEVDTFGVPALAAALAVLGEGPVSLDVSELSYICARGAATLARAGKAAADEPSLILLEARPIVRRIWQILGFDMQMLREASDEGSSWVY
jgi:anti-anti-sigma regulatory factor